MFRKKHPLQDQVERVTSAQNTQEDWQSIFNIVDSARSLDDQNCGLLAAQLEKKLKSGNPRVTLQTLELTNALVKDEQPSFLRAVCSRDFTKAISDLASSASTPRPVVSKLGEMLKDWEAICQKSPQFSLMVSTVSSLRSKGVHIGRAQPSSQPSQVSQQTLAAQEEEMLKQAIQASLQEQQTQVTVSEPEPPKQNEKCQPARVLYSFDGVEDNELSLEAGSVIDVLDDSDANWWRGRLAAGGEGYFPASFVTYDLSAPVPKEETAELGPAEVEEEKEDEEPAVPDDRIEEDDVTSGLAPKEQVTEAVFDEYIESLKTASVDDNSAPQTLDELKAKCETMSEVVGRQMDMYDDKLAELNNLNDRFTQLMRVYERLMHEAEEKQKQVYYGSTNGGPVQSQYAPSSHQQYPAPSQQTQPPYSQPEQSAPYSMQYSQPPMPNQGNGSQYQHYQPSLSSQPPQQQLHHSMPPNGLSGSSQPSMPHPGAPMPNPHMMSQSQFQPRPSMPSQYQQQPYATTAPQYQQQSHA